MNISNNIAKSKVSDSDIFVSTSQAAQILNVHESSIKRWCNDNLISAKLTRGGHRRLRFAAVLDFARRQKFESPILSFAPVELEVWLAVQGATKGRYAEIGKLMFDATVANRESFAQQLSLLLLDSGVSVGHLFDHVFGPVLRRIGDEWLEGSLTTGDEHRMTQILADCIASVRNRQPILSSTKPLALVACAPGEIHELGALMVRATLEYSGWQTIYLGRNAPAEDIASQQLKWDVRLVCISFVPPHGPADALLVVRALTRMYDQTHPYSLAIGGGNLLVQELDEVEHSFTGMGKFSSISDFNDWTSGIADALRTEPESISAESERVARSTEVEAV